MMNAVQPKTADGVLAGLQQHGASVGAKKMLRWEFRHARDALLSGTYVTLFNPDRQTECARIGKMSRCFCNHLYGKHKLKVLKNGRFGKNPCAECKCENFRFMWRRPEEIGQNFLVRRKGFDINMWRPLCGGCKHPHPTHDPVRNKCKECPCAKFISNFACLVCDGKWEAHETLYEDEELRRELGKAVGPKFYPLADNPEIQEVFLQQLEEEAAAAAAEAAAAATSPTQDSSEEVQGIGQQMMAVSLGGGATSDTRLAEPGSLQARQQLTLPKRDQPEKSVRLMQEKGMLRKYD